MLNRLLIAGAALPAAFLLTSCADSAAPDDTKPDFHVISATCDFMTGGGFVGAVPNKITYGVHAGRSKDGTVFGHFNVVDHKTNTRYQSTHISTYGRAIAPFFVNVPSTGVTRVVEGQLRVNGGAIRSFTAYLNDSGEPGKRVDRIFFRVGSTEIISAARVNGLPSLHLVDGGNLQFHDHCIKGNPQSGK
jgi:hypothetical protein